MAYGGYALEPTHVQSSGDFGGAVGIGRVDRGRQRVAPELVVEGSAVPNRVFVGAGPGLALWVTPAPDGPWSAVARVRCPFQSDSQQLVVSPGLDVSAAYFPEGRSDNPFFLLGVGVENHLYAGQHAQEVLFTVRLGVGLTVSNLH